MAAFKWIQASESAAGAFAAALALWTFAEATESWAAYDDKQNEKSSIAISGAAYTLAAVASAKATMDLNTKGSVAAVCFVASWMLNFVAAATRTWANLDLVENGKSASDGQKAAVMLQGLFWLAGTGASLKAAMDWKDDRAQAAHAAGWAFHFFATATIFFALYDTSYEKQTDADTIKAGQVFAALFSTIATLAFGFSAFSSKGDLKTMAFVGALLFFEVNVGFIERWRSYDVSYEGQSDEDVVKTAYVFQGLCATATTGLFGLAAFLAKEDQGAINWEGSDGKIIPA